MCRHKTWKIKKNNEEVLGNSNINKKHENNTERHHCLMEENIYTFSDRQASIILYCIVLYCIMRPYTDGPIGPLSYRHSSGVVRNPHSTLAE